MKITLTIKAEGQIYEIHGKDLNQILKKMKLIMGSGDGLINKYALQHTADKIMMVTKNRYGKTANSKKIELFVKEAENALNVLENKGFDNATWMPIGTAENISYDVYKISEGFIKTPGHGISTFTTGILPDEKTP